jgi:hypothetical protein
MARSEFEDITPHVVLTFEHGLPVAYQRSVLRADPDRVEATLAEIEAIVRRPDSSLRTLQLEHRPDKAAGFIELAGTGELDARAVRDTLRAEGLDAALAPQYEYLDYDPDSTTQFGGLPAKEGHGTTRAGLLLVGVAPPPRSHGEIPAGRRPVVAVLDTEVREHPWLGDGSGDDAFWRDARAVEDGWAPDFVVPEESADVRLSHAGHGTFIAGIVRLLAPDARVLSVPVMQGNGVVEEAHVLDALRWLYERVTKAVNDGRPELFVDVVNLSFGRYQLDDRDSADTAPLREVLRKLSSRGVQVVASAGNRPVETFVFPAAFGEALVSVGARDPDGTPAAYTSTGPWVSVKAPGTSLVSALPRFDHTYWPLPEELDANGVPKGPDPNFQASGVGQWSGTSFAAAWVSGSLAAKLLEQATPRSLAEVSPDVARPRVLQALEAVKADLERSVVSHDVVE